MPVLCVFKGPTVWTLSKSVLCKVCTMYLKPVLSVLYDLYLYTFRVYCDVEHDEPVLLYYVAVLIALYSCTLSIFRAHCLDSKSVMEHGVYMPRGNPLGCFITRDRLREEEEEEDLPATPPGGCL